VDTNGPEFERGMLDALKEYWWVLLVRGLLAVAFGLVAVAWPDLTLFWVIMLFGVYVIGDGLAEIWSGFQNRSRHDRWWVEILIGLAGIVAGILIISLPGVTAVVAMYFIAAWMVVMGVLQVIYAIRLRETISNEWLIVLAGVLSVLLGLYFFAFPGDGAVSLVWLVGVYAILFGVILAIFSFRARKGFS